MATTHRFLVFATCFISGIAALVSIVSLATEEWITSSAKWTDSLLTDENYINYGLFQGSYQQVVGQATNFQITMTCNFGNNVCAVLCGQSSDARQDLLNSLYNNTENGDYSNDGCTSVQRTYTYRGIDVSLYATGADSDAVSDKKFINSGVWLSTVIFLIISILMGLVASALGLYNTIANPIEVFFSITGMYVYNAVACCSVLLYMILWGVMYNLVIFHDVGIFYTLAGKMNSEKTSYLGYSYWINFIPLFLYMASIAVLYVRQYLISKEPASKNVHLEDSADPVILLY